MNRRDMLKAIMSMLPFGLAPKILGNDLYSQQEKTTERWGISHIVTISKGCCQQFIQIFNEDGVINVSKSALQLLPILEVGDHDRRIIHVYGGTYAKCLEEYKRIQSELSLDPTVTGSWSISVNFV